MKAVGREARQATQSVREAEAQGGTTINVNYTVDSGADLDRIGDEISRRIQKVYEGERVLSREETQYRVKPHAQIKDVGVVINDTTGEMIHQFRYFDGVSTAALTAELARRMGVEEYEVEPYESYQVHTAKKGVTTTGPARILVVTD